MSENYNDDEIIDSSEDTEKKRNKSEKFCFLCRRPESKAGPMIELPNNIHVCTDCMQKSFNSMNQQFNEGKFNYSDLLNMPNVSMIDLGNSGGALLNMKGELIGINSAKYADSAVEGMGYAIPISKAKPILEELMNRETREKVDSSKKGYLGVSLASLTTEAIEMYNMPTGAFVRSVEDDSPAQEAGICKGDIIVKFDGQKVSDGDDLLDKLQYYKSGEKIEAVIARATNGEYEENTIELTLGTRPDNE